MEPLQTWRGTGLNLITRSPQSEIDLPPNDIHLRHQYERRKTIKVLLGDEPLKKQISNKYTDFFFLTFRLTVDLTTADYGEEALVVMEGAMATTI